MMSFAGTGGDVGDRLYDFAKELYPIHRSITGAGVRRTLDLISRKLPALEVKSVNSGTRCFDWTVPDEWNIRDGYIIGPDGRKFCRFTDNNLHVVGYSEPVDTTISLDELNTHLHSRSDLPNAIPYVTSYYQRRWGFCISDIERRQLQPGLYRAVIDAFLAPGQLVWGELVVPGESDQEILLSTNVCHPSLGNNEVSGPTVLTFIGMWLSSLLTRRYTYRLVFVPETIGAIAFLARDLARLRKHVVAGFNVVCVGDDRCFSFLPSRTGETLTDRVGQHVMKWRKGEKRYYSYLDRGSDERQYCSPGVELPVISLMRSKYGEYPEYHTSLDDLSVVSAAGLYGAFDIHRDAISCLEGNLTYLATNPGEPQLGRHGLQETLSLGPISDLVKMRRNILAYCDGRHDLLAIAEIVNVQMSTMLPVVAELAEHGLITATRRSGVG